MLPAIQIDETARVTDKAIIGAALAQCAYRLPGAIVNVFGQLGWQVVEQAYDLPDVYVCYMEICMDADEASIPIHCPMNDLYWLYILLGKLLIARPGTGKAVLREQTRHYRLGYFPKGHYNAQFSQGNHHLFYVVHKPSSLFREDSDEFMMETAIFNALKTQASTPAKTDSFSMRDGAMEAIRGFLTTPGKTALRRRQAIEYLAFELVFKAYESHCRRTGVKAVGAEWAGLMTAYIDECIETGEPVDMHTVALKFGVSVAYVRLVFDSILQEPIGQYITERKLEFSKTLLERGEQPTLVALLLCWNMVYFGRIFKKRYQITPSAYRKSHGH